MNKFICFVSGAAIGSLTTYIFVKNYYRQQADEEIKSVVERFKKLENELNDKNKTDIQKDIDINNEDIVNNENDMIKEDYNNIVKQYQKESNENLENQPIVGPYIISPEEFDENGYDTCCLTYYQDDVLVNNDDGTIIVDIESIIGDALEHFGEYEDDCIHVRDDENATDYEILKSNKTFKEVYRNEED